MKRILTLLAVLSAAVAAHAQTDSLVTFDTQGDLFGISIAGFNISLGGDKEETYTDAYIYHEPRKGKVTTNFLGASLGGMVLIPSVYYGPWEGSGDFLEIYPGKSSRIDLEIANWTIPLDNRGISYYRIGTMFSYDRYQFKNNITLTNDDEGSLMPVGIDGNVKKTKLMANYWGLNMGFGFKRNKIMILIQGTAELLTKSAVKYKNPDKNVNAVNGLYPFRSRISLSTTWDGYGFYIDYCLTPLFKPGVGNDTRTISLGCRLGF